MWSQLDHDQVNGINVDGVNVLIPTCKRKFLLITSPKGMVYEAI